MPLKVFLNYRHEDTHATAWALYMKLEERFSAENVFFDGSQRPGMRWPDEIKSHLADSDVVIALIGPQWISGLISRLQTGGEDYVVKEIDLALRSGPRVTVIPVLVDNAQLPDSSSLPPSLRALPRCQAERLRLTNLADDIDHLIKFLSQIPDSQGQQSADLNSLQLRQRAPRRPSSAVAPAPDDDHYRMVAGTAGNLVVFLGSGANSDDGGGSWSAGSGRLPDDRELASFLATRLGLEKAPPHLAEVAQYAGALRGETELFQWVKQVLQVDVEPGPVHRYLAHLPVQLGRRCQMIITPQYDAALEKAFTEAGEDYDVVVYMAPRTEQAGRFVHLPWDAFPRPIDRPNEVFSAG